MSLSRGSKREIGFVSTAMKDCLTKAITSKEGPLKTKYIREIIILTTTENGAGGLWNWIEGKHCVQNYIMLWKFCYVLHKIFNEGHSNIIMEARTRSEFLSSFSSLWDAELKLKATKGNYDTLISYYSSLLLAKLKFHLHNPKIHTNLEMNEQEFYKMLDTYHNSGKELKLLCSELMYYWDFVIAFLTTMHLVIPEFNNDSSSIQCKIQPLSICLNECINLYTFTKSLLFQLHADVEPNSIQPLKEKFDNLFHRFQEFISNTEKWPKDSSMKSIDLPKDPPKFEMVHSSPDDCRINQTHFHGVLNDETDNSNSNTLMVSTVATAPNFGSNTNINFIGNGQMPTPTPPSLTKDPSNVSVLNDELLLREYRIKKLEDENRILIQKVQYFESSSTNVQRFKNSSFENQKMNCSTEVESLKAELQQLKINSGQQFLQLYTKIREKDELLSQLQVEKNQYELLAQMNLERLQLELQQNEQSDNSNNLGRMYDQTEDFADAYEI